MRVELDVLHANALWGTMGGAADCLSLVEQGRHPHVLGIHVRRRADESFTQECQRRSQRLGSFVSHH
jgi:hypothetical protein